MKIYNPTGFSTNLTGSFSGSVKGTLTATGNIIPVNDQAFDLGTATQRFRDIYLSSASIYLGNKVITEDNVVTTASLASTLPAGVISGSNQLAGETIDGDLTITGTVTAQEFHTEFVSASIIYQSGSTQFGNSADDTHVFRGQLFVSASDSENILTSKNVSATGAPDQLKIKHSSGSDVIQSLRGNLFLSSSAGSVSIQPNGGYTGIGATSPRSIFHIVNPTNQQTVPAAGSGNVQGMIVSNDLDTYGMMIGSIGTGVGYIQQQRTDTVTYYDLLLQPNGGNVGIGTGTPSAKLHVEINSASEVDVARFRTINGADNHFLDISVDSTNNLVAYDSSGAVGGAHVFRRGGSTVMVLDGGSNVGIGTTSTNRKLQVNGAAGGYGQILISTDGTFSGTDTADLSFRVYANPSNGNAHNPQVQIQAVGLGSYDAALIFKTAQTGGDNNVPSERMRIDSTGRVGINTSPQYDFHIGGASARLRVGPFYTDGGGDRDFVDLLADGQDSKVISNNERFHIENNAGHVIINTSSNVGIGTTAPTQKLEVLGNIKANSINGKVFTDTFNYAVGATFIDTITTNSTCIYEYTIVLNPNTGGSSSYIDYYYGKVGVGAGWNGSNVTMYIWLQQDQSSPRSLYPSGGGDINITANMLSGGSIHTSLVNGTTYTIRFQGFPFDSLGTIYMRRLA